jgi:glyoxylate/hydroxypyruvate reductase
MKKTAILVNPGRGSLVDSTALCRALESGELYAAGLDVVEGEPNIPGDHPLVLCGKCTLLPHIGSATFETRVAMATLAADNLIAGVLGHDQMRAEYFINQ